MDDITLLAIGDTPHQTVQRLHDDLQIIKGQLRSKTMMLNDAKEQILGPTSAVRKAWHQLTGKAAVDVVKDLGTYHYGYGEAHPELDKKLDAYRLTASRVGSLPVPRERPKSPRRSCTDAVSTEQKHNHSPATISTPCGAS